MVVVLAVACELGFRTGVRKRDASEQFRSLMNSVGAATFGLLGLLLGLLIATVLFLIMDVNRPQRGTFQMGVATLERVRDSISPSATP
jgi:hypothetical protein